MTPKQAGEIAARARKLLRAGKLTHRQFALLDALLWSGRRPGSWDAVASYTALQRLAHQARSTVADGLRTLARLGLLTIIKRRFRCGWASRQGTSTYRFAPAASESSRAPVIQEIGISIEAPLPGPDLLAQRRAWWESQWRRPCQ